MWDSESDFKSRGPTLAENQIMYKISNQFDFQLISACDF